MVKQANIKASLKQIQKETGAAAIESQEYFNKILAFLDKHTNCEPEKAAQIALNETRSYFKGDCL